MNKREDYRNYYEQVMKERQKQWQLHIEDLKHRIQNKEIPLREPKEKND